MKKRFIMTAALLAVLLLLPLSAFAQEDEAEETGQEVEAVEATEDAGVDGSTSVDFGPTNTESRIFHVDLGFMSGYRLEDDETVVGRTFALTFALMESGQLAFENTVFSDSDAPTRTDSYNLVRLDYFFSERISLSIGTGASSVGGTVSPGGVIGANALIFRSVPESGLSSTMKASVRYLMNEEDGFGEGTFGVALIGTIGL